MTVQIKYPNENIENPNNDEELKVVKEELNKEKQKNATIMMGLIDTNNRLRVLEEIMQGVYAYALIDNLITEKEIADLFGKEYLEEVLVLKNEILKSM